MEQFNNVMVIDFSKSNQNKVRIDGLDNSIIRVRTTQIVKLYEFLNEDTHSFKRYCEEHNIKIERI